MRKIAILFVASLLALGLGQPDAESYEFTGSRWSSAFARMYGNNVQWSSSDLAAINGACSAWSTVEGCSFRFAFQISGWDPSTPNYWNGKNDVYVADLGPGTLGITEWYASGNYIVEADVCIDTYVAQGLVSDMPATVLHELGHALGLGHEDDVPAIMNSYDAGQQGLYPDDRDGIRSLYPSYTPPTHTGPDVAVKAISHSPSMALGRETEVRWTIENRGATTSSSFDAVVYLDGEKAPGPATGTEMARSTQGGLAPDQSRSGYARVQVPDELLPGTWYLGVRAEGVSGDVNALNNSAAPPKPFRVERDELAVGPRDQCAGTLGPYGHDGYLLDLPLDIKIKAKLKAKELPDIRSTRRVSAKLGIHKPGISIPFDWDFGRKIRLKPTTIVAGVHEIRVENDRAVPLTYELKLKIGSQKKTGSESTGTTLNFHAWTGCSLKGKVKSLGSTALTMTLVDPDGDRVNLTEALKVRSEGRKLKLKLPQLTKSGEYSMTLGGTPSGYFDYSLEISAPAAGILHQRD